MLKLSKTSSSQKLSDYDCIHIIFIYTYIHTYIHLLNNIPLVAPLFLNVGLDYGKVLLLQIFLYLIIYHTRYILVHQVCKGTLQWKKGIKENLKAL